MSLMILHVLPSGIDIERCVKESIKLFNHTPPSANMRRHDNPDNRSKAPQEQKFLNLPVSLTFHKILLFVLYLLLFLMPCREVTVS